MRPTFVVHVILMIVVSSGRSRASLLIQSMLDFFREGGINRNAEWDQSDGIGMPEFDFIIVGAGTAGCALASRLSENPDWTVLLLEAGGHENLLMDVPLMAPYMQLNRDIDWAYQTEPSNSSCLGMQRQRCNWPRGRVMGGSSVLNYMIYTRGNRRDYDRWAELGATGWSYADVLPYFQKLEHSHVQNADAEYAGHEGPLPVSSVKYRSDVSRAFVAAGREAGFPYVDYNGRTQIGVSYLQMSVTTRGRRASSNVAYLYPIRGRRNLFVRKHAFVTKILMEPVAGGKQRAVGVQFTWSNGDNKSRRRPRRQHEEVVRARKEVIVSAGAINSPQLLMLSGIGPQEHLEEMGITPIVADLPVGLNLMDHIAPGGLTFTTNATTFNEIRIAEQITSNFNEFMATGSGYLASAGAEALLFVDTDDPTDDADGYPDIELLQLAGTPHTSPIYKNTFNLKDEIYNVMFEPLFRLNRQAFMIMPMVLRPRSRGRLLLASRDPFRYPQIFANYLSDPYDMRISLNGIRKTLDLMDTKPMRQIDAKLLAVPLPMCARHGVGTDAYWECYTRHMTFTIYHYAGTCRMGAVDDPRAVVDPRLRVRGVGNLRVIDASVFPDIMAAHPNAGVFMVAEKGADLIKEDWRNSR